MTSFCGKEKRNKATFNTSVKMRPGTFGLAKAADDQKKSWERRARAQSGFWRACKAVPQPDTGRRRPNAYVGYAFRLLLEATSAIFYSQEIHFANGSKKKQKNQQNKQRRVASFQPSPKKQAHPLLAFQMGRGLVYIPERPFRSRLSSVACGRTKLCNKDIRSK